jgi:hypothetical protein
MVIGYGSVFNIRADPWLVLVSTEALQLLAVSAHASCVHFEFDFQAIDCFARLQSERHAHLKALARKYHNPADSYKGAQ